MGTIYMYTNRINGKQYIGQTIHTTSKRAGHNLSNYIKSAPKFGKAILKYGYENFSLTILHSNIEDRDLLNEYEKLYIEIYNTIESGYNISEGGYMLYDKVRTKIKETHFRKYRMFYTKTKEFKEKSEKTCLEKYNNKTYLQSDNYKEKNLNTLNTKYHTDNVFKLDSIKQKIKDTNIRKYGYENPLQNEYIKKKNLDTRIKNGFTTNIVFNDILFNTIQEAYEYAKKNFGYNKTKANFKLDCYKCFMSKESLSNIEWYFNDMKFKSINEAYRYAKENNLIDLKLCSFYELMYKNNIYLKNKNVQSLLS